MVNYLAVLVCGVASIIIGMVWYSPKGMFGKSWMKLSGLSKMSKKELAAMQAKGKQSMVLAFVSSLVMAFVLSHLLSFLNAGTLSQALQTAFWVWLGFIATVVLSGVLWENKPWKLYWINSLYYLALLLAMGAILTVLA